MSQNDLVVKILVIAGICIVAAFVVGISLYVFAGHLIFKRRRPKTKQGKPDPAAKLQRPKSSMSLDKKSSHLSIVLSDREVNIPQPKGAIRRYDEEEEEEIIVEESDPESGEKKQKKIKRKKKPRSSKSGLKEYNSQELDRAQLAEEIRIREEVRQKLFQRQKVF